MTEQPRTMADPQGRRAVAPSTVCAAAWPIATFASPVADHGFDRLVATGLATAATAATPATPATRPPELSP